MRHFRLPAELDKLPSVCCFHTVRACQKIAEAPPLQIPSFKSFENRTDCEALVHDSFEQRDSRLSFYGKCFAEDTWVEVRASAPDNQSNKATNK